MYFHRLPKLRFILLVILLGHYAIFLSSVEAIVFVIAPLLGHELIFAAVGVLVLRYLLDF